MISKLKQLNEALPNMFLVDAIYFLIGEIIILIFLPDKLFYSIGFLFGIIYSIVCSIQMSFRIRKVVYGKAAATKTLLTGYIFRLLFMVALFGILYYFNIGDLIAALIGMFAMKVSAYLQPLTNKFLTKICEKGG